MNYGFEITTGTRSLVIGGESTEERNHERALSHFQYYKTVYAIVDAYIYDLCPTCAGAGKITHKHKRTHRILRTNACPTCKGAGILNNRKVTREFCTSQS